MIIGQVLVKRGIITEKERKNAIAYQKEKLTEFGQPIPLGRIIVQLGFASEKDIVQAVNRHYNLSVTSLSDNIRELVDQKRGTFWERLPRARLPIWLQLSVATILITMVTILMLNFIILSRQKEQLYDQTVKIGLVSLNYLADEARIPLLEDDLVKLNTLVKNVTSAEGLFYGRILDHGKTVKAHTDLDQIGATLGTSINMENKTRIGDVVHFNYSLPNGKKILNLTRPILFQDKVLGEAHVGVSIDFIEKSVKKEQQTIITITFLIVVFGILIAVLLGIRFSRPISKLVVATREIGRGYYNYRVDMKRNDELGTLAAAFNQMGQELLEKSLVQESFGKYVGAEVLDMILANPEKSWLRGQRKEATTLFADIRGFTLYSDQREPEEVIEGLNLYFEIATRVSLRHGGFIDKFIGDGLLVIFGVPVFRDNHVERAVLTAIELQSELNRVASINGNKLLSSVGISIDTGVVVSGNIGSQVKMEYTVIGSSVNVASRLNGLANPGEIIISRNVYKKMDDRIVVSPLPPQSFKGIPDPVEPYKILHLKGKDNEKA
jgi:adenylate cyclase